MSKSPALEALLRSSITAVVEGSASAQNVAAHAREHYVQLAESESNTDSTGLSSEEMALSVHKNYVHDRAGNKHALTDKQRRFFLSKIGSAENYKAALERAKKKD